jgi:UDP-N-acetyl-2-amino-2-deoxyglucuronate dehydrogenase
VQWFGGPVARVQSELGTFGRKIECEDTGAALVRFHSGAIGVLAVSMLTYPENLEGSLTFLFDKATLKVAGKALNKLEVCRAEDPTVTAEANAADVNYEPKTIYGNGHAEYYKRLTRFLKEPSHPEAITGREGLKSLKLLNDIYRERDGKA